MPELVDSNALFDLFKSGEKYKILKIFNNEEDKKYAYNMLFFVMREMEMKTTQEIVDDVANIIDFKEIQAKMAGKQPPDGNWLKDLQPGTRFLAFMKMNATSLLGDFILGTDPKELPAVYLGYENGPQGFGWKWHDPVKFCKEFGLYSILEVSDGNSNKVSDGTVESDGQLKVVPPVHESK